MSRTKHTKSRRPSPRLLLQLAVIAVAIVVLWPQAKHLSGFSSYMRDIDVAPLLGALVFSLLTFVFAALSYVFLSPRPLSLPRTVVVQIACSFANRLLPGGIGGMGINERYLERSARLDSSQATSIVSANQLVGFLGYIVLFVLLLASFDISDHITSWSVRPLYIALGIGLVVGIGFAAFIYPRVSKKVLGFATKTIQMLYRLARRPRDLFFAFCSSIAITFCFALAFYLSCIAADVHVAFGLATLIYLGGAAIASATPTPGGLGGVEAAMVAGLIGLDVPGGQALAAVMGFRLITFWLPILPGYIALQYANQKRWL